MKRAFRLLIPVLFLAGCQEPVVEQSDNLAERTADIDSEKDNEAFKAIYNDCKKQINDPSLNHIRGKIDLLSSIFVGNNPPPYPL